ncbi:MAG: MerR family transcriptional regulator [Acidobacteria bacterium]|nr:MerR family transcriptional regulator [Acidobacteriota bacterium]
MKGTQPSARGRASRVGLLTVSETAGILGVSPSTLRLWENVGLITPARSNGRYRLYSPELLEVLKRIKYLRDVKQLNLPGIRQVLGKTVKAKSTNGSRPTDLGPKLRRFRKRTGLGVVQAAKKAKISAGFLSAIELSRANPSVATLHRLAVAYGTTTLEFFDLPKQSNHLVRPRDRRAIQTQSGVRMELLSVGARQLETQLFRVQPGAGSDGSYSHQGEEFIYMMSGSLEIWLDELQCHTLNQGDSFWFESTVGHRWYNPSSEEAVLLWVNTPPTF